MCGKISSCRSTHVLCKTPLHLTSTSTAELLWSALVLVATKAGTKRRSVGQGKWCVKHAAVIPHHNMQMRV